MSKNNIPINIIKRSLARLVAVQSLYQYEFHKLNIDIEEIKEELLDNYLLDNEEYTSSYRKKVDLKLLEKLIPNITKILDKIDEEIEEFLQEPFSTKTLPDVMLQIIRLATFELKFIQDTPLKVIINEYVDIAGCFYGNKKVTFVNSILENIAKKNRKEEFIKIKKGND